MMQGSGEIFNFFLDDTFSGGVNPTGDTPVPVNFISRAKREWIEKV
jgi:hypothetical protein